jgi:predicted TIM-barrel fold metal-dependent hydrolase
MIDGVPVIDAVIHAYNMDPSNYANRFAKPLCDLVYHSVVALATKGFVCTPEQFYRDWPIEDVVNQVLLESQTDLAVYHVLPIGSFHDGLCSLDKAVEVQQRWPDRVLTYCGVDPMLGDAAIEEMERQVELLHPVGLKLYPNSWVGNEIRGWKMDDPEIAFPLFARAQQLGLKVVAVHKALPLGPVPMEHYKVDDIDRAAMTFPDLNFEIVHGGMAFLEETAWQLARFPNVYVNLEITSALAATRPLAFVQAMAALVGPSGAAAFDRLLWGTGAMAFHPQPPLKAFWSGFEFPAELIEKAGLPPVTQEVKRKILFDNWARMTGMDLQTRLQACSDDSFSRTRTEKITAPFSTIPTAR